jgi:hypothetical protein
MAKKTRKVKRVAKKVRTPRPPSPTPPVPKDLKAMVLKKYRTRDKTKRYVVVRLPKEEGCVVQCIGHGQTNTVREFRVPPQSQSEVPIPVRLRVDREVAIWWARMIARRGQAPSAKQELSRRRRILRMAVGEYLDHMATKQVVTALKTGPVAPKPPKKPKVMLPFIFVYDPMCRRRDPVFHVHTAYCTQLDKVRKRMLKRGGTSWVVEATRATEAVALQLAEFTEDKKGYDGGDFDIHGCAMREKPRVTSKTTLGRVSDKPRRG